MKLKKLLLLSLVATTCFLHSMAQVPQKFNYQGVARDAQGAPIKKANLKLRIEVLPTDDATVSEYEEIQTVTTNEFGLYTLQIGAGTPVLGEMKSVKWETGNKYIRVAIDPKGGNDFQIVGTTQLLSVPYAIYADKAGQARETVGGSTGGTRAGTVSTSAAGTGTVNYLTKFTAANTIYNSQLFDNGTNIGLGTTSPASRLHISAPSGNVEHLRMENLSSTGIGKFIFYNDVAANYHTFSKYGSTYPGNYGGMAGFPYANLLAMGSNNSAAVFACGNNLGFSLNYGATAKFKFFAHHPTGRVGIGGNSTPAASVHFNNTDGTSDTLKITNNTTGHLITDGLDIRNSGNAAQIINLENSTLSLGTNNATHVTISNTGNVGVGTVTPGAKLEVAGQVKVTGGAPGVGKVLTSDATGLATWTTPSITSAGGTTNFIPKYTPNGTTLGNSNLKDSLNTGLIYNSSTVPDAYTGFYYNLPVNKSSMNINTPLGSFYHNYINLTSNSSNPWQAVHFADSAKYFNWFNNFASPDSIGSLYYNKSLNQMYLGNATPSKGFQLNVETGKMGNIGFTQNGHFNVNTSYDTAATFTSNSSNFLANGILRAEYTGSTISDQVALFAKSKPSLNSYGKGIFGEGGLIGIHGYTESNENYFNYGVYGQSRAAGSSYGVYSIASNNPSASTNTGTKYGGYFNASGGQTNYGVLGAVTSGQGIGYGGYFQGKQTGAYGVSDSSSASQTDGVGFTLGYKESIGLFGKSNMTNGALFNHSCIGVAGSSINSNYWNIGVYAESREGLYNYSIYSRTDGSTGTNYAGYFDGDTYVGGTLSKAGGTFKIDHPQDPANKYLIHSFVESPDMMNVYNGNITTDANGKAIVNLPSYFEAENKDFKYQLTVVDQNQFAQARISRKVQGNQFEIMTDKPNVEISWQVTGVRQDAWANAHRVVPEVEKPQNEQGHYLHPKLFGYGDEKAIGPNRKVSNPSTVRTPSPEEVRAQEEKEKEEFKNRQLENEAKAKDWKKQPEVVNPSITNDSRAIQK